MPPSPIYLPRASGQALMSSPVLSNKIAHTQPETFISVIFTSVEFNLLPILQIADKIIQLLSVHIKIKVRWHYLHSIQYRAVTTHHYHQYQSFTSEFNETVLKVLWQYWKYLNSTESSTDNQDKLLYFMTAWQIPKIFYNTYTINVLTTILYFKII